MKLAGGGARATHFLPAAYEVDDFELVSVGKVSAGPLVAGDDGSIQLDRDTVRLHT